MPKSYTPRDLQKVKEQIALERPHTCNCCGTKYPLSHSHLVKASRDSKLYVIKENIVYHCMDTPDRVGCHTKFECADVATMKDFEDNFKIIHTLDREYFWIRIHKLDEIWKIRDMKVWRRVRALLIDIDTLEHPKIVIV